MEATKINTPEQRLELYKEALKDYESCRNEGSLFSVCGYLGDGYAFCAYFRTKHKVSLIEMLCELWAQKPESASLYWFSILNAESRIDCLKAAILLAEEKIMCDEIAFNKNKL